MAKPNRTGPVRRPNGDTLEPSAETVEDYLYEHPGFLLERPNLLAVLTPPFHHSGKGVVDMQRFMIERLQEEVEQREHSQSELLDNSRRHMSSQSRVHAAVLEVIAASNFEELVETITTDIEVRLDLDVVKLCVEAGSAHDQEQPAGVKLLEPGTIDRLIGADQSVYIGDVEESEPSVYGSATPLVASHALLRLRISNTTPEGLLALGSRNPEHFEPSQSSELLQFLARVIEITIRSWLGLTD